MQFNFRRLCHLTDGIGGGIIFRTTSCQVGNSENDTLIMLLIQGFISKLFNIS